MAKFKVGDEVVVRGTSQTKPRKIIKVEGDGTSATYYIEGSPYIGYQEGLLMYAGKDWATRNSRAPRSTNAVVQNALNACARNGKFFCDERDYPTIAAVKKEYPGQIVKRVTGGWMVFDTTDDYNTWKAQNACGTARNADKRSENDRMVADFLRKAKARIGAEIETITDSVRLADRSALSDKGKNDLAALKNILTKLVSAGLHL